jgi:hypothetical protein
MDLASLDTRRIAEEGVEIELRHPVTDEPLEIHIRVAGVDSTRFRDALIEVQRARRARLVTEKRGERTPAEIEEDQVYLLATCTLGWRGVVIDGAEPVCNEAEARRLYMRFPWVRTQLDDFIQDRRNFLPRSVSG